MGDWHISIQGTGCHHNNNPMVDADLATKEFLQLLAKQGHQIVSATFTSGSRFEMQPATHEVVVINGTPHEIKQKHISFEEIVSLAGLSGTPTCTWSQGYSAKGILSPGQILLVYPGLRIDCIHTGNA